MREGERARFGAIAVGLQDLAPACSKSSNLVWVQNRQEFPENRALIPAPRLVKTQNLRADELPRQLPQGESLSNRVIEIVLTDARQADYSLDCEELKRRPPIALVRKRGYHTLPLAVCYPTPDIASPNLSGQRLENVEQEGSN